MVNCEPTLVAGYETLLLVDSQRSKPISARRLLNTSAKKALILQPRRIATSSAYFILKQACQLGKFREQRMKLFLDLLDPFPDRPRSWMSVGPLPSGRVGSPTDSNDPS